MSDLTHAERLVEQGRAFAAAGDEVAAERSYRSALALEPAWPSSVEPD
jgi:hypothetical protein